MAMKALIFLMAACSMSAASSCCTVAERPERNAFACCTSLPYSVSVMRPTQGAEQRLIW